MGNLKSNKTKEEWDDLVDKSESHSNQNVKITRFEVINHANNSMSQGRLLTLYSNQFDNIELSYQDDGRTLKIFLT
jgi:hypothetical protein